MTTTDRVPRGFNTTGAAGGRLEPVHGYVVRARCADPGCGEEWHRSDYDTEWRPGLD